MRRKFFVYATTVVTILGLLPSVCSAEETSDSGWGTAQVIETDHSQNAFGAAISTDSSGNAIAVWYQDDGVSDKIWSNRYVVGTGWGTAQLIGTGSGWGWYPPQVSMDSSGNAIAVWYQDDGVSDKIWSNRYVVGTGWGTALLIGTGSGDAWISDVSVNRSGDAIAVWGQSDGTRYNVWSNRYVVGTGWGIATLIETDDSGSASDLRVSVDGSGNAIAVWSQSDGVRDNIWSNRYVVGTGWGTAQLIETDDSGYAWEPQVSCDSSGNAIAVWSQSDGFRANIWSNRYTVGTGWGTAQLIETNDSGEALGPELSMDSSGDAIAVWYQWDGVRFNIWSNRYVAGTGWGTAELVEFTPDSVSCWDNAVYSRVSVNSSGNAIAVWHQFDGTYYNIWSNRYVVGTGWGTRAAHRSGFGKH